MRFQPAYLAFGENLRMLRKLKVRLAHGPGVHPADLLKPLPKVPLLTTGEPAT